MPNVFTEYNDYINMHISSPKFGEFDFIFNKDKYDKIKQYHWSMMVTHSNKCDYIGYYASANKKDEYGHRILLHRLIAGNPQGKCVDHIDGNTFNNKTENLRICTRKQNSKNRKGNKNNKSGHKGVLWDKSCDKWMAYIMMNYTHHTLGYFDNFDDAVKVREKAEQGYFGEFSREANK